MADLVAKQWQILDIGGCRESKRRLSMAILFDDDAGPR